MRNRLSIQILNHLGVRVVILNCLAPYARVILDQAHELRMITEGWAWLLTDGITTMVGNPDTWRIVGSYKPNTPFTRRKIT